MAASYQIDALNKGFDVIDGARQNDAVKKRGMPGFIDRILHASTRRLRFSVLSTLKDPQNFERHLKNINGVEGTF